MKKYEVLCLSLIFFVILCINVRFLNMKSGYYVDEGMTLFLANGHYNGTVTSKSEYGIDNFIKTYVVKDGDGLGQVIQNVWGMLNELLHAGNYSNEGTVQWYDDARSMLQGKTQWISGEALFREIVADKGERFQYAQVYLNQIMDVHPCFYYFLVHTVFSIFSGNYSDAFLFGINITFLIMTCLVVYCMVKEYSEDVSTAFLSVVLFGFSQGFASCAMYFRMYAVLTFFIVLTLYVHLKLLNADEPGSNGKKIMTRLGGVVLLGFNTHYYYLLFLFPLFLLSCLWIRKNRALLRDYIKCMIHTGVVSLIIWPFSVYHILFGYRGTEAVSNVFAGGFVKRCYDYVRELGNAFFLNNAWIVFILLITMVFCLVAWHKQSQNRKFLLAIIIPCAVYFTFIVQIAPTVSDRYIMCLLPCIAILMSLLISGVIRNVCNGRVQLIALAVFGIIYVLAGFCLASPNYLYLEQRGKVLALRRDKEEYNCVMLGFDHGQGFPAALKLSEFGQVLVAGRQEIDYVTAPEYIKAGVVIYIYEGLETSEYLKELERNMNLNMSYVELDSDIVGFRTFVYEAYK